MFLRHTVEPDRAPAVLPHHPERGRPLTDRMTFVELIAATTTKAGLKIESALDTRAYEKGIKVSDAQMKALDIQGDPFHPEWNYTIRPARSYQSQRLMWRMS
jgi:Rhodopirellula transposase DDE domain